MKKFFLLILLSAFLLSCNIFKKTENQLDYLKDIEQVALETSVKNSRSTIQPGDQLEIFFLAPDMDVVAPFNQSYSASAISAAAANPNRSLTSDITTGTGAGAGPSYVVDSDGFIQVNILGKIQTAGKNTEELRDELTEMITRYVKKPTVYVRYKNYRVSVMGEVNRPNTYQIPEGKITVLEALALAGDLTMYGKRDNVLVLRNVDGQIVNYRVDLNSANFINSPAYYLKQNDVVYVQPNTTREKTSRLDPNTNTYIAIGSIAISLASVLILLFRK